MPKLIHCINRRIGCKYQTTLGFAQQYGGKCFNCTVKGMIDPRTKDKKEDDRNRLQDR